jgi:hypothetical protein
MKVRIVLLVMGCWLLAAAQPAAAQEALVNKVKVAIKKGIDHLFQQQRNGHWDELSENQKGGVSCLAMLALLEAGVDVNDKRMVAGLDYVRRLETASTYVRSLQTQVLAKAGMSQDLARIEKNVQWLIATRVNKDGNMLGWGYGSEAPGVADGSNTQFALLGLWAGKDAGIKIPQDVWKSVRSYYLNNQLPQDGSWIYRPHLNKESFKGGDKMTMTTAGICGLLLSGMEIEEGREQILANGQVIGCGVYKDNPNLAMAMKWMEGNFTLELPGRTFYNLYGIERLGRLTGHRFIKDHDWYREGCDYLVKTQNQGGSWTGKGISDDFTIVNTSFALLFLSKGRTPVLISKLVHGTWPRQPGDNDWNLDRNAVKHWTEHISATLFKQQQSGKIKPMPLAWQIFDLMHAVQARGEATDKNLDAITSDMLQSPIIFMNGHNPPKLTDVEKQLLSRYVENGGFIVAEACCGKKGFDFGFRQLVNDPLLWEHANLVPLGKNHPVWHYPNFVEPGKFKLHGLERGCKTILIYSPEDLSCYWEAKDKTSANGALAFKLAENIVAYATGMIPPMPRLTETSIASKDVDKKTPPRFYLKAAQLYYRKDWTPPAPAAVSNLMDYLRKQAGMDVVLTPEKISIDHEDLVNFKFIYFHDRKSFQFDDNQLKQLRFNLETGGLLFADACCGKKDFDTSFRKFMKQLFPKQELKRVPINDALFSKELNGEAITKHNIKARQAPGESLENVQPWLEGIQIDGRWVVLYSKYDIGCALERHTANDCIGYDHESAKRIAGAAVLYLMSP